MFKINVCKILFKLYKYFYFFLLVVNVYIFVLTTKKIDITYFVVNRKKN